MSQRLKMAYGEFSRVRTTVINESRIEDKALGRRVKPLLPFLATLAISLSCCGDGNGAEVRRVASEIKPGDSVSKVRATIASSNAFRKSEIFYDSKDNAISAWTHYDANGLYFVHTLYKISVDFDGAEKARIVHIHVGYVGL
jgi:hypothetical protein